MRSGVGIDDPEKPTALVNDHIGVAVEGQKGGDFFDPFLDMAVVKNAAFCGDIVGKGNLQGGKAG